MKKLLLIFTLLLSVYNIQAQNNQLEEFYTNANLDELTVFYIDGEYVYFAAEEGGQTFINKINLNSTAADKDIERVVEIAAGSVRLLQVEKDFLYVVAFGAVEQYNIALPTFAERNASLREYGQRGVQGLITRPRKLFISYAFSDRGNFEGFYELDDIHNNPVRTELEPNLAQFGQISGVLFKKRKVMYYVTSNFDYNNGKVYKVDLDNDQRPIYNTQELVVELTDLPYDYTAVGSISRRVSIREILVDANDDYLYLYEGNRGNVFQINLKDAAVAPKLLVSFDEPIVGSIAVKDETLFVSAKDKIYEYDVTPQVLSVEGFEKDVFRIYPNPTSDYINFSGLNEETEVSVYSQLGTLVAKTTTNKNIDISGLTNGIYFVRIKNSVHKFMKK
ncbi:T9SS type A sorting domain-containing protein [Tenacibaculum amylolyticum]|uniref:T9SS type A sorting domain-containing protein n=1 Tax=Tenacibaculum amylolyticum TaxID=104269 RepID=UPI003893BD79